jgi:hypothetical protein
VAGRRSPAGKARWEGKCDGGLVACGAHRSPRRSAAAWLPAGARGSSLWRTGSLRRTRLPLTGQQLRGSRQRLADAGISYRHGLHLHHRGLDNGKAGQQEACSLPPRGRKREVVRELQLVLKAVEASIGWGWGWGWGGGPRPAPCRGRGGT